MSLRHTLGASLDRIARAAGIHTDQATRGPLSPAPTPVAHPITPTPAPPPDPPSGEQRRR